MQRDDVRGGEQTIERHRFRVGIAFRRAAGVGDAHAERSSARGYRTADAAVADDAELFAFQLGAEHEVEGPAFPLAAPDEPLPFTDAPRDAENECPREIRGRIDEHA